MLIFLSSFFTFAATAVIVVVAVAALLHPFCKRKKIHDNRFDMNVNEPRKTIRIYTNTYIHYVTLRYVTYNTHNDISVLVFFPSRSSFSCFACNLEQKEKRFN